MRLIDADELLEKMYRYTDNEGAKMPYGDNDSLIHKDSACFLIENAPTIEPERKKGKWIKKEPTIKELHGCYYECSKCHKFSLPFQKLNFCPNCGADMRGEQNDTD